MTATGVLQIVDALLEAAEQAEADAAKLHYSVHGQRLAEKAKRWRGLLAAFGSAAPAGDGEFGPITDADLDAAREPIRTKTATPAGGGGEDVEADGRRSLARLKASRLAVQHGDDLIAVEGLIDLLYCRLASTGSAPNAWRPMETAPRDGTLLRLLVEFTEHATEDSPNPSPTIGANNFDNDGEDRWQFAGWCWSHDHFTQGQGKPVGWLPMLDDTGSAPAPSADTKRLDWLEEHEASLVTHREDAGDDEYSVWWNVARGDRSISGHPLGDAREAIDAAMSVAPTQEAGHE